MTDVIEVTCDEYYQLIKTNSQFKYIVAKQDSIIKEYKEEIKKLNGLLEHTEQVLDRLKSPIMSVDPDGNVSFKNDNIKRHITKEVVREILLDNEFKNMYEDMTKLYNKVQNTLDAIKKQDGISIERSLEREIEAQIQAADNFYLKRFTTSNENDAVAQRCNKAKEEILKDINTTVLDNLKDVNMSLEIINKNDQYLDDWAKYKVSYKGSAPIYKVVGVCYNTNDKGRRTEKMPSKLVLRNTQLSGAAEITASIAEVKREIFRDKVTVDTNVRIINNVANNK